MRFVKTGLSLAVIVAAPTVKATDWYTGAPPADIESAGPKVTIDTSLDATSRSSFAGALVGKMAPFGSLAETGPRIRASVVLGRYAYNASDLTILVPSSAGAIPKASGFGRVNGTFEQGSFMTGYELVTPSARLAGFVGPDVANHHLSPLDPGNRVRGMRLGAKMGAEAFFLPSATTMVSSIGYYSTNYNAYFGRFKFGVMLTDYVYAGPEALALGDNYFSQWRVGAHLSGLKFGALLLGVSGGYLNDRVRGGGAYSILDTHLAF